MTHQSDEHFDWSSVLNIPPAIGSREGNQILHFNPYNKPYWENAEAKAFKEEVLSGCSECTSDAEVLKKGSEAITIEGLFIELGVCTGKTINFIAALNPQKIIYGFDSFEGLPEDWKRDDVKIPKGTFAYKNPEQLPPVLHNVKLFKGWFDTSLKAFDQSIDPNEPVAFACRLRPLFFLQNSL